MYLYLPQNKYKYQPNVGKHTIHGYTRILREWKKCYPGFPPRMMAIHRRQVSKLFLSSHCYRDLAHHWHHLHHPLETHRILPWPQWQVYSFGGKIVAIHISRAAFSVSGSCIHPYIGIRLGFMWWSSQLGWLPLYSSSMWCMWCSCKSITSLSLERHQNLFHIWGRIGLPQVKHIHPGIHIMG